VAAKQGVLSRWQSVVVPSDISTADIMGDDARFGIRMSRSPPQRGSNGRKEDPRCPDLGYLPTTMISNRRYRRIRRCRCGAACSHRLHLLLVETTLTSRAQVIPSDQEKPSEKTEMLEKRVLDR
jgi:hypothetical protein